MTDRGYARISNDTSRSGSIDKQRARIGAYAGGAVEWYEDRSVSGSKVPMWEREGGGKLLADLQRGDRVLITKIDRQSCITQGARSGSVLTMTVHVRSLSTC